MGEHRYMQSAIAQQLHFQQQQMQLWRWQMQITCHTCRLHGACMHTHVAAVAAAAAQH